MIVEPPRRASSGRGSPRMAVSASRPGAEVRSAAATGRVEAAVERYGPVHVNLTHSRLDLPG
ncbi:MAG: hypothetical protein QOG20_3193 [Pseudonocardiales bacterium]|nr:hypothetical protein [Pseudonocardiales bacterium]